MLVYVIASFIFVILYVSRNKKMRYLNGNQLKAIALVTMLIDHIGYVLLQSGAIVFSGSFDLGYNLRIIGRTAFPIYAFLITEGYKHTHSFKEYAGRLFGFALISEVFADLAYYDSFIYFEYQNVFFTLLLGLFSIYVWDRFSSNGVSKVFIICCLCLVAESCHTDYGAYGVLLILLMYVTSDDIVLRACAALAITIPFYDAGWMPLGVCFSMLFISLYNGERGKLNLRNWFYWFYPVHLLALYGIVLMSRGF